MKIKYPECSRFIKRELKINLHPYQEVMLRAMCDGLFMPELVTVNPGIQHGDETPLLKSLDDITSATPDALTSGLLCMAMASDLLSGKNEDGKQ